MSWIIREEPQAFYHRNSSAPARSVRKGLILTDPFPVLKKQHDDILEILQALEANWEQKYFESCRRLTGELHRLLEEHHKTECGLLFDKVRTRHQMREGGPFCSYFFDFFMNNRPQNRVEKAMTQWLGKDFVLSIPDHLNVYFTEKSLFCIPLEEHLAAQAICLGLIRAFAGPNPTNMSWIQDSLSLLRDLIQSNFRKEETCLWEAIKQIKDPHLQADLSNAIGIKS